MRALVFLHEAFSLSNRRSMLDREKLQCCNYCVNGYRSNGDRRDAHTD